MTKVSPEGSASKSGGVEVGDQLAAINGTTSVNMKVDDICSCIDQSPQSSFVELVFLRYQGPIRPAPGSPSDGSFDFEIPGSPIASESFADEKTRKTFPRSPSSRQKNSKKSFRWFGRRKKKSAN